MFLEFLSVRPDNQWRDCTEVLNVNPYGRNRLALMSSLPRDTVFTVPVKFTLYGRTDNVYIDVDNTIDIKYIPGFGWGGNFKIPDNRVDCAVFNISLSIIDSSVSLQNADGEYKNNDKPPADTSDSYHEKMNFLQTGDNDIYSAPLEFPVVVPFTRFSFVKYVYVLVID